jgi:hypothetical protein
MNLQIKVKASELNAALDIVSVVPPRPVALPGGTTGAGYLFNVVGDKCYVYSRDSTHVSRAVFQLDEANGEGMFIYPADQIQAFRYLQDFVLTFEASSEGNVHRVKYTGPSGTAPDDRMTYDPKLMSRCDDDVNAATGEWVFPVALLRDAIGLAKPFMSIKEDAEDMLKTIQVFDDSNEAWAKGNGTLFAANGVACFYFYCDAFKGKGLGIHHQHFPFILTFLSKCKGDVTIKRGPNMTFAINTDGGVLGWAHQTKRHQKFGYYALSQDKMVFDVPVDVVLNSLSYIRLKLGSANETKIKVTISAANKEMLFSFTQSSAKTESFPVVVYPHTDSVLEDKSFWVNIDHLTSLMHGAKGDRITMRLCFLPANEKRLKEQTLIRTLDEFVLDRNGKLIGGSNVKNPPEGSFQCSVTRYVSSRD